MPPSSKRNIALTGFMAVGKSVVGKKLARRLHRRFMDLDQAIEEKEKMTVSEIFNRQGESYFRTLEKQLLSEVLKKNGQVIATGGGAILDKENLDLLRERALLICLTAPPATLLRRSSSGKERPLLKGEDRERRVEELLRQREEKYVQAHLSIDTASLSVDEVVARIIEVLRSQDLA